MNVFLVEQGVEVSNIVNPVQTYNLTRDIDIGHAAITLDQLIFGSRRQIDWVLFAKRNELKFEEFCIFEKYISIDSKIIFSTCGNLLECYYCRPEVFSIIGSKHKTNDDIFHFLARHRIDIQHI